jgi:glycosyltransferase involved in cell wall biosynthesis
VQAPLTSSPPRVLLVANTSWYIHNFRFPLLRSLRDEGYDVAVVAPHDGYTAQLQAEGFKVHHWLVARRSINPLTEAHALIDLLRIYQREQPDLVHHFTVKACLYGTIAAKGAHVYRVINAITGLGHVFVGRRRRTRVLCKLLKPAYRSVFMARRATVVFQNPDDQDTLIQLGITDASRARLIRGSGVDIDHFSPNAVPSSDRFHSPVRLLFPSRLINEKGVRELLTACRQLWSDGNALELWVAGELDPGNRSALSASEVEALRQEVRVRCLGHVDDMRALYADVDIVVLPSWREGLSRALIEAAAMERPIITTDVPGCRDVVIHGVCGLLVPLRNPKALRLAIQLLLQQPELARSFGKAARARVAAEFQVDLVNKRTLDQYRQLLSQTVRR